MSDILLVKCNMFVSRKQLQNILDYLKSQKETGVILLPPYLDAQLVPNDIEIKLVDTVNCLLSAIIIFLTFNLWIL